MSSTHNSPTRKLTRLLSALTITLGGIGSLGASCQEFRELDDTGTTETTTTTSTSDTTMTTDPTSDPTTDTTVTDTTTTEATGPMCGDGVVDDGEDCDDGDQNLSGDYGSMGDCASDCTLAKYCGDADVNGPEGCDDGTNNGQYGDVNGCAAGCEPTAYCGDGNFDADNEKCNNDENDPLTACSDDCETFCGDGEIEGDEQCDPTHPGFAMDEVKGLSRCDSSTCNIDQLIVFVTSSDHTGALEGILGADDACKARAEEVGLASGTTPEFLAWIGYNEDMESTSPSDRFTTISHTVPYIRVDGIAVANSWEDLIDGSLENAINVTEKGTTTSRNVWTNCTTDGAPPENSSFSCNKWTSEDENVFGGIGSSDATSSDWSDLGFVKCNAEKVGFYCFQQLPSL